MRNRIPAHTRKQDMEKINQFQEGVLMKYFDYKIFLKELTVGGHKF